MRYGELVFLNNSRRALATSSGVIQAVMSDSVIHIVGRSFRALRSLTMSISSSSTASPWSQE
jgi:hypothetical protein